MQTTELNTHVASSDSPTSWRKWRKWLAALGILSFVFALLALVAIIVTHGSDGVHIRLDDEELSFGAGTLGAVIACLVVGLVAFLAFIVIWLATVITASALGFAVVVVVVVVAAMLGAVALALALPLALIVAGIWGIRRLFARANQPASA